MYAFYCHFFKRILFRELNLLLTKIKTEMGSTRVDKRKGCTRNNPIIVSLSTHDCTVTFLVIIITQ